MSAKRKVRDFWAAVRRSNVACSFGVLLLLAMTTLGAEVSPKQRGTFPQITVSAARGFHEVSFLLSLSSPVEGATIRYTLDGSEPTVVRGPEYGTPLTITNTTILRAAGFKEGERVTAITTYSYIFADQVLRQTDAPPGFPAGPRAWNGQPSAYQMDPRVVDDPLYRDQMIGALKSLPVVSLVCHRNDLFGARTGLYLHSLERGEAWERACSAEMILPDGGTAFQVDCGLRMQGNYNRIPGKSPKHSFRLLFKEKYGPSKLHYQVFPDSPVKKFDTLVLRADYNNSWVHWDGSTRPRAQRTRDAWMKDSHRAMGWIAGHNRYVHLFLNGLYWGLYDFAERPDASFAAAYFGGDRDDYDVINEFEAKDGTLDAFRKFHFLRGLARGSQYEKLLQHLDLTEFIDYLLLNYYAGNQDWGENKNWYAIRRHTPPGPFRYIVWDGEQVMHDVHDDTVSNPFETPFRLAEELKGNVEFRLAFADRVQKHFFNDGVLTPAASAARWMKRANEVDRAIMAESARWGYYRRNPPYTRNRHWLAEQQRLLKSWFPRRTAIVLEQLRAAGLYPGIAAPVFNQHGGNIANDFNLTITSSNGGTIYYTTNGTDPRISVTGAVLPGALTYSKGVSLRGAAHVKTRVLKDRVWSALSEATFTNSATRPTRRVDCNAPRWEMETHAVPATVAGHGNVAAREQIRIGTAVTKGRVAYLLERANPNAGSLVTLGRWITEIVVPTLKGGNFDQLYDLHRVRYLDTTLACVVIAFAWVTFAVFRWARRHTNAA